MVKKKSWSLDIVHKRSYIDIDFKQISIFRQCELLNIHRSGYYYEPLPESLFNLEIMRKLDEQYTRTPFYGVLRMHQYICSLGYDVNIKRIRRLLRQMGVLAIYPKRNLSIPNIENKKYPYLLKNLPIERCNQVWSTDITYIPMEKGFLYLVAVIDWYSRYVISWRISNTMEVSFCLEALNEALEIGKPEIFNSDQGSQFTSNDFTDCLLKNDIQISMDGKGRCLDNVFVERLWRSVKYEYVFLNSIKDGHELWHGLDNYFHFYNEKRFHQSLDYQTPANIYWK